MNTINLVGRLGKDPETTKTKNDKTLVKFSIATNDGFGDNKKTNWHNCVAFGKTGEIIAKYVSKGDNLAVSGSIDYNKYEDKYYTSVLVNTFTFIQSKADSVWNNKNKQQSQTKPESIGDEDGSFLY